MVLKSRTNRTVEERKKSRLAFLQERQAYKDLINHVSACKICIFIEEDLQFEGFDDDQTVGQACKEGVKLLDIWEKKYDTWEDLAL